MELSSHSHLHCMSIVQYEQQLLSMVVCQEFSLLIDSIDKVYSQPTYFPFIFMFVGECLNTLTNKLNKAMSKSAVAFFAHKRPTMRLQGCSYLCNAEIVWTTVTEQMKFHIAETQLKTVSQANKRPFIIIWVTFRIRTSSENSWENRLILFAVLKSCWMHFGYICSRRHNLPSFRFFVLLFCVVAVVVS